MHSKYKHKQDPRKQRLKYRSHFVTLQQDESQNKIRNKPTKEPIKPNTARTMEMQYKQNLCIAL